MLKNFDKTILEKKFVTTEDDYNKIKRLDFYQDYSISKRQAYNIAYAINTYKYEVACLELDREHKSNQFTALKKGMKSADTFLQWIEESCNAGLLEDEYFRNIVKDRWQELSLTSRRD